MINFIISLLMVFLSGAVAMEQLMILLPFNPQHHAQWKEFLFAVFWAIFFGIIAWSAKQEKQDDNL